MDSYAGVPTLGMSKGIIAFMAGRTHAEVYPSSCMQLHT